MPRYRMVPVVEPVKPVEDIPEEPLESPLEEATRKYREHSLAFIQETILWGTPHTHVADYEGPLEWQIEFFSTLDACIAKGPGVHFMAVSSGKGVGKTATLALAFLWHLATHEGHSQTIAMSVTGHHSMSRFWREVRIWYDVWYLKHYFKILTNTAERTGNKAWVGQHQTWHAGSVEGVIGIHAPHAMYLVDEASGIPDHILQGVEATMTGHSGVVIYASNPTRVTGQFRECFRKNKALWLTWNIDARTVPIVSAESIERQLRQVDGDEDASSFCINVRGIFPVEGHDQTIPERFIGAACERFTQLPALLHRERLVIGVDLARRPGDKTVFVVRQQTWIYAIEVHEREEPEETAERLQVLIQKYHEPLRALLVFVSGAGHSQRVVDLCGRHQARIQLVEGAGSAAQKKWYADRRSELWYLMRQWLKDVGHVPPTDMLLIDQLQNTFYAYDDAHRVCVESQDTIRERGLMTPNIAEALADTFAGDDQSALQVQGVNLEPTLLNTRRSPIMGRDGNTRVFVDDLPENRVHPAYQNRVQQRFDARAWDEDKREYMAMLAYEAEQKRKEAYQRRRAEEWGL